MKISVVIPTINSEKRIKHTTFYIDNYLKKAVRKRIIKGYEIILVPQVSKDNTFDVVKKIAKKRIRAIYLPTPGKGIALTTGIKEAKNNFVLTIDDDLSYPIEFLEEAVKKIKNYDIVIGSRYLTKQRIPLKRKIASLCYRTLVKILFNLSVKDPQAGLKLIKKDIFKKIGLPEQIGYVWDTELLFKAQKHGFRICEIPIKYNFVENVLKIRKAAPEMLKGVIALWLKNLFKK